MDWTDEDIVCSPVRNDGQRELYADCIRGYVDLV